MKAKKTRNASQLFQFEVLTPGQMNEVRGLGEGVQQIIYIDKDGRVVIELILP